MFDVIIEGSRQPATSASSGFAAILASGGAAIGAFAAGAMAVLAYVIKIVTEALTGKWQRERRRLEVLRALRSELRDSIQKYRSAYLRPDLTDDHPAKPKRVMSAHFDDALLTGVPYIPFVTFVASDMLWDVIRPELAALDGKLLDDIASYYYADKLLGRLFADLRSDDYKLLSIARQQVVALDMFDLTAQLVFIGRKIVRKVDVYERGFWNRIRMLSVQVALAASLVAAAAFFAWPF